MRIAIVDTGLDMEYYKKYYTNRKVDAYSFVDNTNSTSNEFDITDDNGHGTACFSIINRIVDFAEYLVVKVCEVNGKASSKTVTKALDFLLNENVDIICLAISVLTNDIKNYSELELTCKLLANKGVIIVASYANNGIGSCPACFERVIGVSAATSSVECGWVINRNNINIVEDVKIEFVEYKGCYILSGNSLATSIVTAKIANIINETNELDIKKQILANYKFKNKQLVYNQTRLEKEFVKETIRNFESHMDKHILFEAMQLYELRYNKKVEYEKLNISACNSIEDACHQILKGGCLV